MEMGKDIWDVKTYLGSWVKGLLCSQGKKSLKSASLGVKIAVEVDMIEIESKLRAHWEQISKNQAIFSELLWLFHKT